MSVVGVSAPGSAGALTLLCGSRLGPGGPHRSGRPEGRRPPCAASGVLEKPGGRQLPFPPGRVGAGGAASPLTWGISLSELDPLCGRASSPTATLPSLGRPALQAPPRHETARVTPAGSRSLVPSVQTRASLSYRNVVFPVREPQPSRFLQLASTSGPLQRTVLLPRGRVPGPSQLARLPPGVSPQPPPLTCPQTPCPVPHPLFVLVTTSVSWSWAPPRTPGGKALCAVTLPESLPTREVSQ